MITTRPWFGHLQYPGLEPFYFGTVFLEQRADSETARVELKKAALMCLPDGFEVSKTYPGQVIVIPEERLP